MKTEVKTEQLTIHAPWDWINKTAQGENTLQDGYVVTRWGFVKIDSRHTGRIIGTTLCFAYDGFFYSRSINRFFSTRYLITLANRFAREIVEGGE